MNEITRIETITAEIVAIKQQTVRVMAQASFEIGKRLCEAKQTVPAGEWMMYLQEKLDYGVTTAENLMKIYKEYGDEQVDLLTGKSPSEIFAGLNQSQMVAMFSLEPSKRIELVENTPGIEDMSSRQIAELTKQLKAVEDEAKRERKQRENAEKIAQIVTDEKEQLAGDAEQLRKECDKLNEQVKSHASENRSLMKKKAENDEHIADLERELEQMRAGLEVETAQASLIDAPDTSEQEAKIAELEKTIAELKARPVPEDILNEIRNQLHAGFAEELNQAKQRAESAEKKLDVSAQRVCLLFEQMQKDVDEIHALLEQIQDLETAEKLRKAIPQVLRQIADTFESKEGK